MGIKRGGAHIDERGQISGGAHGDQTGSEVSICDGVGSFTYAYRHKDPETAAKLAQAMYDACLNSNIGYNQEYRVAKKMAQKYGSLAEISEKCATDCSELISACIWQATGIDCPSFSTSWEQSWLKSHDFTEFVPSASNVYNGDILWKSGHTEMIVSGRPRTGQNDPSGDGSYLGQGWTSSELYTSRNTRKDMLVRQVGYLNTTTLEPTISSTEIGLSIINYTTLLGDLFKELVPASMLVGSAGNTDTSALPSKAKTVVDYFISKGLTCAAACGIAGNIKAESDFRTDAIGDNGTSFGICQWHLGRGTDMKNYVGSNWRDNLTGQLEFLWSELNGSYKSSVLTTLRNVSNTEVGAKSAADVFVRKFEMPANVANESAKRQANAASYFNSCVVLSNSNTDSPGTTMYTQSGSTASVQKTVTVPSSVNQTGVIPNYTNYSYFYPKWTKGTTQRKLADIWAAKGKKSSRNIATIDEYYLVAMSRKFATTGDIVVIVLEDGQQIKAILGDQKGSDATSPWGHTFGSSGVNIIEWESTTAVQSNMQLGSWKGKKVKTVYNYGSYLR